VIFDVLSRLVDLKGSQGDITKSVGLVEVSSKTVADAVLGHLKFAGMHDRHRRLLKLLGRLSDGLIKIPILPIFKVISLSGCRKTIRYTRLMVRLALVSRLL